MAKTGPHDGDLRFDIRLPCLEGDMLLKVKRTSTAVDLRGALVSLAYALADESPSSQAICVLTDTRLTEDRVQEEINQFRKVLRPELAARVHATAVKDGAIRGLLPSIGNSTLDLIIEFAKSGAADSLGRVSQQAVRTAALTRWLTSKGRLGVADLRRTTGASMPTVIAAFRTMRQDGLVFPMGTGWQLADELSWECVRRIVEAHAAERRTIRFVDPSRLSRTPLDMAKRLSALQVKGEHLDVDLGGVLGAQMHYPDLDITGPPRLDLCVYGGDTTFVRKLDAGLLETADPERRAVLVLHLVRNPRRDLRTAGALRSAYVVDCLADLLEIGLQAEARDFWRAIDLKRRTVVDQQDTLD